MDRIIVYPVEQPTDTDLLNIGKFAHAALGRFIEAVIGTGSLVYGLPCSAGSGLNVQLGSGSLYTFGELDQTAYGSLGVDSHPTMRQAIISDTVTLSCPAPSAAGQSIDYLIEVAFEQIDGGSTVLPFYNSAEPSVPYSGPANDGSPSFTIRQDAAVFQVKAGAAAATGSQTAPAVDSGFIPLYVVTVDYGQGSIANGKIAVAGGAPFLTENLLAKISEATADLRYQRLDAPAGGDLAGNYPNPTLAAIGSVGAPSLITALTYDTKGRVTGARTLTKVVLTSGTSWTPPSGVTQVYAECLGGGGGGAGAGSSKSGGGGGAGGYAAGVVTVTPGTPVIYAIGAAGAAGGTAQDGLAGGTTSFGSNLQATGGGGGIYNASVAGGAPGVGSGSAALIALDGGDGTDGHPTATTNAGNGGASALGGGGRGGSGQGVGGRAPGSGGGGAYNGSGAGGAGAPGLVILTY